MLRTRLPTSDVYEAYNGASEISFDTLRAARRWALERNRVTDLLSSLGCIVGVGHLVDAGATDSGRP